MARLHAVSVLVLVMNVCTVQGITLRNIPCFTWEVKQEALILTCSVDHSEKIIRILNPHSQYEVLCENLNCTSVRGRIQSIDASGMTYILPLDDDVNGLWSCIHTKGQLTTNVSINEGIQGAQKIIIDGRIAKTKIYTTANTCPVPYRKNAEIFIDDVLIDVLTYHTKEKTCFHVNKTELPCLPEICNCSSDGKSYGYVFQLHDLSTLTNVSYQIKFKVGKTRVFITAYCLLKDQSCLKSEVNNNASTSVSKRFTTESDITTSLSAVINEENGESHQYQMVVIIVLCSLLVVISLPILYVNVVRPRGENQQRHDKAHELEELITRTVEKVSGQRDDEMFSETAISAFRRPVKEDAVDKPDKEDEVSIPAKVDRVDKPAEVDRVDKPAIGDKIGKPAKVDEVDNPTEGVIVDEPVEVDKPDNFPSFDYLLPKHFSLDKDYLFSHALNSDI